jgi:NAD-dependent histone deacetylase SIR2
MKIPGVRRIVREMCRVVRGRKDGITMWINRDSPPVGKDFEDCWDLVIKGDSDEVARLARLDPSDNEVMEITASDEERIRQQGKPSVVIPIRKSSVSQDKSSMQLNALHPAEVPYRANPASKGRPLSEVIPDRKPGKKPAKPASKRKSKANDQVNKINQTYKVSKSSGTSRTKIDKSAVVKCEDWPKPMVEISSGSPRSNGPMPPKPNDQETISPKGPIPNGMRGLLTIENPAAGK